MIALVTVFFMFLLLFGLMGAVRGWGKELLVVFSVLLALAVITLAEDSVGLKNSLLKNNEARYWFRTIVTIVLVFFGYQSPSLPRFKIATEKRDRIQDHLFGFVMGLLSGYFVVGALWSFASQAKYPFLDGLVQNPPAELKAITDMVMSKLPPVLFDQPITIFISVVVAFVFAIIFFL